MDLLIILIFGFLVLDLGITLVFHKNLFEFIRIFWNNLRDLFYNNKTLFDIFFFSIYLLEQLTLFFILSNKPEETPLFAGIFAILFISTISLEKICMESRYRYLEENISASNLGSNYLLKVKEDLLKNNENLRKVVEKLLKNNQNLTKKLENFKYKKRLKYKKEVKR